MISSELNCLFVHVPKVAGQSIEEFFMQQLGLDYMNRDHRRTLLMYRNYDPALGTERLAHLAASEYVDCGFVDQQTFDDLYKFSFVRNPWTRLLSEYLYRNYLHHRSFRHFVLKGLPRPDWKDEYRHVMPQYDMLYKDGELLVDFVGRFETLPADFEQVCQVLGLENTGLAHRNTSEKRSRRLRRGVRNLLFLNGENGKQTLADYYDDDTREAVARIYRKDIETFGYEYPG